MKKIYRKRREALVRSLQRELPQAKILGQAAGMHLVVELPGTRFTPALFHQIHLEGVQVYAVEHYAIHKGRHEHQIVMGYGSLTIESIHEGVVRLRRALERE
jgi:GntR family transcriptional regulator/MocR family aminotransferase